MTHIEPIRSRTRRPWRTAAPCAAVLLAAGCASGPVDPNAHAVGSLHVLAPGAGWKAVDLPVGSTSFTSNAGRSENDNLKVSRRALVLPGAQGRAEAVVLVATSERINVEGNGYVTRSLRCNEDKMSADFYADPLPARPKQPSCAWAWPRVSDVDVGHVVPKAMLDGLHAQGVKPPAAFDAVVVDVMNDNGRMATVWALVPPNFKPQNASPPSHAPAAGFPAGLASWADALGQATLKAVTSVSGQLVIPPGSFSHPPTS